MKLVIFGATGSLGTHLIEQTLAQGHTVTAFVRTPSKLAVEHSNLRIVKGDVLVDQDRVAEAVAGQDAVLIALGTGARGGVRAAGTVNVIEAMKQMAVKRLICQTSLGAGDSFANLNWLWRFIFRVPLRKAMADHQLQEQHIRQSDLDWTIVRPAAFTDGEQTGNYRHGFGQAVKDLTLKISRADVADFMLKQLANNRYLRQTPGLSY